MTETLFNKFSPNLFCHTFERISSVLENKKPKIAYHDYFSAGIFCRLQVAG